MIPSSPLPTPFAPWVKVCGVRTYADLEACARAGATHVGLNPWPRSPRFVPANALTALAGAARTLGLAPILLLLPGACLSPSQSARLAVALVQVLAPPPAEWRRRWSEAGTGVLEARPLTPGNASALPFGDALLLDARAPGRPGGTGKTVSLELAALAPRPFVLAGGLGPDNVAETIAALRPAGVDAASGLESSPGVKDPGRISAFCAEALAAFQREISRGEWESRSVGQ
ncbi:MAG: phosphoribosylanthranilate isomerase [Acidobacteriota bacterium]